MLERYLDILCCFMLKKRFHPVDHSLKKTPFYVFCESSMMGLVRDNIVLMCQLLRQGQKTTFLALNKKILFDGSGENFIDILEFFNCNYYKYTKKTNILFSPILRF